MPNTNTDLQRKAAFYHSLGKVITLDTNLVGNERYKSSHNVRSDEVWIDTIPYSADYTEASSNADDIVVKEIGGTSPSFIYPLANTNYQTWFIDLGTPTPSTNGFWPSSSWVRPLINPTDVPDSSGNPSVGYNLKMFRPDGTTEIEYIFAYYDVDYFSGLIRFEKGETPVDSGAGGLGFVFNKTAFEASGDKLAYINNSTTGGPRAVAFQYVGIKLSDLDIGVTYNAGTGITISNNLISVKADNESIGFNANGELYVKGKTIYDSKTPTSTLGNDQPTGITLSYTPLDHIPIKVFVNGQVQEIGEDMLSSCYFYDGNDVVGLKNLSIGDELYWNGNISGYNLETDDVVLMIYNIDEVV